MLGCVAGFDMEETLASVNRPLSKLEQQIPARTMNDLLNGVLTAVGLVEELVSVLLPCEERRLEKNEEKGPGLYTQAGGRGIFYCNGR